WAAGEYDLAGITSGELRTPARAWYFLHFGGLTLAGLAGLELLTRWLWPLRPAGDALALFGQASLLLYTGHVFILPALALADRIAPLRGAWRVALPSLAFAMFCGLVLSWRHRLNKARAADQRARAQSSYRGRATDSSTA